ncbi:MAG TPA: acyl-CoA thioesterase [Solirubrobacteraceae bacterium]|nr:acyl-CoA thioesterase [Solirubrobacteraceae bacterium]
MSATGTHQIEPGRYQVALRWGDMDALGHVNQAVYHELLEEARTALITGLPTPAKGAFVMARVELNYRREIPLTHRYVEVTLTVESIGRSSITVAQQIYRSDGELAADGLSVMVAWDAARRGSRPLSEQELATLHSLKAAAAG